MDKTMSTYTLVWKALVRTVLLFPVFTISYLLTIGTMVIGMFSFLLVIPIIPIMMVVGAVQEIKYEWKVWKGEASPRTLHCGRPCHVCGSTFMQEVTNAGLHKQCPDCRRNLAGVSTDERVDITA